MKQAGLFSFGLDKGAPNLFNNKDLIRTSIQQAKAAKRESDHFKCLDNSNQVLNQSSALVEASRAYMQRNVNGVDDISELNTSLRDQSYIDKS